MLDKGNKIPFILISLSAILYIFLAYFTPRHSEFTLIFYVLLFIFYLILLQGNYSIKEIVIASIFLRIIFTLATPALSDDIYRFIWDGRIILNGENPFNYVPNDIVGKFEGLSTELLQKLNSPDYNSVYPPLSQLMFFTTQLISPNSILGAIVVMRGIILLFEIGTILLLYKLLKWYKLPEKRTVLYAFNPLVILEITGNLHFEGIVLFFIMLSISLLVQKQVYSSAIAMGLGITAKLLPLLILPLFLRRLKLKHLFLWNVSILATVLILFIPFMDDGFIKGLSSGINLYFQKFEFNASLYYLYREYGFYKVGYNTIHTIGPLMARITFLLIMIYTAYDYLKKGRLFEGFIWIFTLYLFMATTVHPWYVLYLIGFCCLTSYRFPIIWSFLIFFTYAGYTENSYNESMVTIFIEYILLLGMILYELYITKFANKKDNYFIENLT